MSSSLLIGQFLLSRAVWYGWTIIQIVSGAIVVILLIVEWRLRRPKKKVNPHDRDH